MSRCRYFVLSVSYDGEGNSTLRNCVIWRSRRITTEGDIVRLEGDLCALEAREKREHIVLNFIPLGEGLDADE